MPSMLRRSFKKHSPLISLYLAFVRSSHSSDHKNNNLTICFYEFVDFTGC